MSRNFTTIDMTIDIKWRIKVLTSMSVPNQLGDVRHYITIIEYTDTTGWRNTSMNKSAELGISYCWTTERHENGRQVTEMWHVKYK